MPEARTAAIITMQRLTVTPLEQEDQKVETVENDPKAKAVEKDPKAVRAGLKEAIRMGTIETVAAKEAGMPSTRPIKL
jgi:hypothetical protein